MNHSASLNAQLSFFGNIVQFNLQNVCNASSIIKRLLIKKAKLLSALVIQHLSVACWSLLGSRSAVNSDKTFKLLCFISVLIIWQIFSSFFHIEHSHFKNRHTHFYLMQATAVAPSQYWDSASALRCRIGKNHTQCCLLHTQTLLLFTT